jgi:hypothetical protein
MAAPTDMEPINATGETTTEGDQLARARIKRYDKRVEEWLTSLKEEAGQRSPEVLSALAAKAKDVAEYLDKMAEKARLKNEASGLTPPPEDTSRSDELTTEAHRDPGS